MLMPNAGEKLPEIKHPYQNHSMDSLRWNFFAPRAGDIVVATSYKAGTTWVQAIVGNLIFSGQKLPGRCVAGNRSQLYLLGDEGSRRLIDAANERLSNGRLGYFLPQGNQWKMARGAKRRRT
jgi:hypothetical protein